MLGEVQKIIIAQDEYWGTYKGQIVEKYHKVLSTEIMCKVQIIEMLIPPRQDAILHNGTGFKREPYPVGSIKVFPIINIEELQK